MKFILQINGTESPNAAYVGWTPAECTLAIEDNSGESPIPVTITAGHDGLEGRISLYTSNDTSSQPVDKIENDFQGNDKITFYVAGKYPNASVGKKDTFIRVESGAGEVPELITKVMVRVRKNANKMTAQEIEDFLKSFVNLNNLPPRDTYPPDPFVVTPSKLLHEIVLMHTYDAMHEIHGRTSFHPWHRAFLMHLEREMQEEYPHVTIPYWKFDEAAENVFTTGFIGKTPQTGSGSPRPDFDQLNPLYTYQDHTAWGPMQRTYFDVDPAVGKSSPGIFTESQIIDDPGSPKEFLDWSSYEEGQSHNQAHGAFDGHVADIGRDPIDPLFFMMHSNVDRLWAKWQEKHNRFDGNQLETYPTPNIYQGKRGQEWANENPHKWRPNLRFYRVDNTDIGNFADDTLWPWNLDNELSRPMRTYFDEEMRLVPQIRIRFPDSATSTYPTSSVTVKSTIDYQDRINNQNYLGFDYDHIPYFDHDRRTTDEIPMADTESNNKNFLDSSLPVAERLEASEQVFRQNEDEQSEALNILSNKEEDQAIRLRSTELIDETTEAFLDTALKIIADPTESSELRFKLIHKAFTSKRSNLHFPSRKPRFFDILRGLIRDRDQKLRFQSISILAAHEDEVVQQFLIDEIGKDQSEFISKPDAIFFLRQNTKPHHAGLFRELFEQSNDPDVRKAAIEGLGNDPNSVDLLEKTVLDERESFKVREAGALSLHNIDREKMNELAAQLIAEPAAEGGGPEMLLATSTPDPDEVNFKAGLLNMLAFTEDIGRLRQDKGLKASLEQVVDKSVGERSDPTGSLEGLSNLDAITDETFREPTIIEQMAAKVLKRFEANDDDE